MNRERAILLKAILLSTSRINKCRYAKDKKVKRRARGNLIGVSVLYLMLAFYSVMAGVGYGVLGLAGEIPAICCATVSILAFMFTILKTNGYLFNFKEYDMLMSLPFSPKTIVVDKFLYMYIAGLPWYVTISWSMLVAYGVFAKPPVAIYFIWILLTFILPMIPMVLASFLGFLIAKVSAGFKFKNLVQTVLTFVFVLFCFSLQYIIDALFKTDNKVEVLQGISGTMESAGSWYFPMAWFVGAVRDMSIADLLLLVGVSLVIFELVFTLVGKYYRQINSAFKSHGASKSYSMTAQKKTSVVNAIAFKEFKRFTGSTNYLVNTGLGEVMAILLGILALFFGMDKIIAVVTKGAPVSVEMIYPAIPLVVYFLIGMVATTACSPSLEGKNYWVLQSLPIEKKTIFQGKILFNLYLSIPAALFATLCLCISAKVPMTSVLLYVVEIIALCAFSSCWGCVCGIKHMRLDWENEMEVVKQGSAVAIYMLPNMFVVMGLVVLVVFLGTKMNSNIVTIAMIVIACLLAGLSYLRVLSLAKRMK